MFLPIVILSQRSREKFALTTNIKWFHWGKCDDGTSSVAKWMSPDSETLGLCCVFEPQHPRSVYGRPDCFIPGAPVFGRLCLTFSLKSILSTIIINNYLTIKVKTQFYLRLCNIFWHSLCVCICNAIFFHHFNNNWKHL